VLAVVGRSALARDGEAALPTLDDATRARLAEAQSAFLAWRLSLRPEQARQLDAGLARERYQRVDGPSGETAGEPWARGQLADGRIFAYFVVGADPVQGATDCRYVSKNLTDTDLKQWFERLATDEIRERRLAREGIEAEIASWIDQPLRFEGRQIEEGGAEAAVGAVDVVRQWAPVVFVYLLWISVFTITNLLLTNTIEEKSNRIIEVLLSSVSPFELMSGKILGIAATGLTVVGSWVVWFVVGVRFLPRLLGAPAGLDFSVIVTQPAYLLSFVSYFLFGYLLYAALLVGMGSVFNSLKEAQNLMQPLMIVLMVPLLAMIPIGQDPNGTLARVLSWIPPFTPFVMMNRAAGPPATWEYVGTTALLIVSVGVATWLASKVFRIGILMTGKPPKLSEIARWALRPEAATPPARD
jgi:ABC-2 type transport system permease protein